MAFFMYTGFKNKIEFFPPYLKNAKTFLFASHFLIYALV